MTKQLILHGRVQGVGMRFFIQRTAKAFSINGTVRNQSDGTVKAILQGDERVVSTMITVIQSSAPGTITHIDEATLETDREYTRFHIRLF